MERRLWDIVLTLLPESQPESGRRTYDDRTILMVGLWAVLHDRPFCWACDPANWTAPPPPAGLPHPSTLSRRWRQPGLAARAEAAHRAAVGRLGVATRYAAVDGRPLPVGGASKDPDAKPGRAAGGFAKGYKLHAVVAAGVFVTYAVRPLNAAEAVQARQLLRRAPRRLTRVVADGAYDSVPLHRVARRTGRRLYTPLRGGRVGRRRQPERVRLARLSRRAVWRRLMASRNQVERAFAHLSAPGFGLKGLPWWARRRRRVQRWVWGKVMLYHAWLLHRRGLA
jgi:hypothetical protein